MWGVVDDEYVLTEELNASSLLRFNPLSLHQTSGRSGWQPYRTVQTRDPPPLRPSPQDRGVAMLL